VTAKAPVPGRVKTRLGVVIGMEAAARVAAAALLDTLEVCRTAFTECHLALDGELAGAVEEAALREHLDGWAVHHQRGVSLGERLANAHADAAGPGPTVQVGMDTPQVTTADLREVAEAASEGGTAVLGPAMDGGWWVLGLADSRAAAGLAGVPMSRPDTFARTRQALLASGQRVTVGRRLGDVDTVSDAEQVAGTLSGGHFLRVWQELSA
jgi:glycosyltransferase A (GT-A) superfamily protein (DUF2064 family)